MKNWKKAMPVLVMVVVLAMVGVYSKTRTETGYTGVVEADDILISAEIGGRILEVAAAEGQRVQAGEILLRMDDSELLIELEKLQSMARIKELMLEKLQEGARAQELQAARSELLAMESQVRSAAETLARAEAVFADVQALYGAGGISEAAYEQAGTDLAKAGEALRTLEMRKAKAAAAYDLLLEGADEKTLALALEELHLRRAEVRSMEIRLERTTPRAPAAGTVREIFVSEGEYAAPGTALAVLDKASYHVVFYVPQKDLDTIEVGREIAFEFQGRPLKARVSFLSDSGEFTPKNIESKESKEEIVFRARADLEQVPDWVRPGMFVELQPGGGQR